MKPIKYEFVQFPNGRYAIRRTRLWVFKSYLDLHVFEDNKIRLWQSRDSPCFYRCLAKDVPAETFVMVIGKEKVIPYDPNS